MDATQDKSDTILAKNEKLLDGFHDDLKKSADEHNKVKVTDFKSPSFYLPPVSKIHELLGFITNQKQWIDFLETSYETPLKISKTSKYAFFSKGVGLRTVSKIVDWLKLIPIPLEYITNKRMLAKILRSGKAGSNAGAWFSTISSYEASVKFLGKTNHEFSLLFSFIEQRCITDVKLLESIKKDVKSGKLTSKDLAGAWQALNPLWENSPHIPQSVTGVLEELMFLHQNKKRLSEQQTIDFIECYIYLSFDFFMEAITHYEIGCRIHYGKNKEKIENEFGMITKAINAFATQEDIKTCFAGILKEFKDVLSELVGDTSYRKLASFIQIEESETSLSGELLEDKQYSQLKDWRNGKNLPSGKKLTIFLENLDEYANTSSGFITFDMCRITLAMDKLVNEALMGVKNDNCDQDDIEQVIKKVFSNITNYYQVNLQTELEKRELAT